MQFQIGSAKTRPGITAQYTLAGNPTVNYLKTYTNLQEVPRLLSLDSLGVLRKDVTPGGALAAIYSGILPGSFCKSCSLFAREYFAFSNGTNGYDMPRQYDDTNFDRVSQCGPGQAPSVVDYLPPAATIGAAGAGGSVNIAASPAGIVWGGLTQVFDGKGYIQFYTYFTVTTTVAHGMVPGESITISASTSTPAVNKGWHIATVPSPTTFTVNYQVPAGSINGGGGSVIGTIAGISMFRQGNITTVNTTAAHGFQVGWNVQIGGIPGIAVGGAIVSTAQQGGTVTVTTTTAHGLVPGATAIVAGVGDATYDGTYIVLSTPSPLSYTYAANTTTTASAGGTTTSPFNGTFVITSVPTTTTFSYTDYGPNQTSNSGGTAIVLGSIIPGVHGVSVIFVTRSGYYTKPAVPGSWTAGGGQMAGVTNIPIGPPNVVARVVCFTAAAEASYYHLATNQVTSALGNMYIPDNVTTAAFIDFSDQTLQLGTLDDPLFNQIVLPPVAGSIDYSTRLFHWGEQNNVQNFVNLSFDGGFSGGNPNIPLGWTPAAFPNNLAGESALADGLPTVFGDAYAIYGNTNLICGQVTQSAAADYLGNALLQLNTAYSVRARIMVTGAAAGTIHVNLQSTSGAFTTTGISLAWNQLTGNYVLYSGNLTSGLAAIPSDLVLQVYVDGTPNIGTVFVIDEIEIFPTNQQFNNSIVRASTGQLTTQGQESYEVAPEGSETSDGEMQYGLNDGTSVRTCFKIRQRLYIVKEHSFGVTQDDGVNEPSAWSITDVSKAVGTPSINGVGIGEDWVVIAHRSGLYLYWGGEVVTICQEIQEVWNTINWAYGWTIAVSVDVRRRRIFVAAPFGESTTPNQTLVLDYHDVGSDASAIASNPPIHLTYTGAKRAFDRARKWCIWTISANCIAQIELPTGETGVYFGSNDSTGNINELDDTGTVFTDNGAMIPSYYCTSFLPDRESKQGLQLSQHRIAFQYLTTFSQGLGSIGITIFMDSLSNGTVLNPQALSNLAIKDIEMGINQLGERMALKFSNSGAGNWFDLQNMVLNVREDPWAKTRGL